MNRNRLDAIYTGEVEGWKDAWEVFFEEWNCIDAGVPSLTVEQLERFEEREDECQAAFPRLVEQWQHSINWRATPEENAVWDRFDQECGTFLVPYLDACENDKVDLGVWPSGIPAAPDEHEHEGALWEIAGREVAIGPELDLRRRIAYAVLFRLSMARLSRRFSQTNTRA